MLEEIHKVLNNREIAICLVFLFVIIWVLRDKNTRESVSGFLKGFFALRKPLVVMGIYIVCIIILLYYINFWRLSQLKDTIYWIFGVALILFFNPPVHRSVSVNITEVWLSLQTIGVNLKCIFN